MIQKRQETFVYIIKGTQIFKEDIDYIILKCHQKSVSLKISDNDYVYENLEELIANKGKTPNKVELKGKLESTMFSSLDIILEPRKVSLTAYGSDDLFSFAHELKDYLLGKVPVHYRILNPQFWGTLTWLLIMCWLYIQPTGNVQIRNNWFLYFAITFLCVWIISFANRRINFRVVLVRKHEHGFFKRNSDALILMVISAVFGALITFFLTLLSTNSK
ncbi:hypothetical protein IM793_12215 [Pedobacter sp. MR2016-19]|uniref:hypothetical protein n=1 Tax=Pedobacter sp. MR2016-19 TaxID=2780089 RepID=UPI0018764C68|nr:hypothetical protein [Pedobacter sp. MR2016-19]MBE5319927.1 hypothetical protein [Pedobacter sp. MR2016-19]